MRQITNRTEPTSFTDWKRKNPNEGWSNFSGSDVYNELKEYLRRTQDRMCCYCEIAIKQNGDSHIEHLKSRHNFPNERFEFDNLYACCQHNDSCGHSKGNQNFNGMVLPNSNCQPRFTYTDNGKIIPTMEGDTDAEETIKVLNLNNKRLKNSRKDIIRTLEDINDIALINQYLANCVDWVNGFFTVIEYAKSKG